MMERIVKNDRLVPLRVIVCGLMRTGTSSMQLALEQLGFRDVYHKTTLIRNPNHCILWHQALDAKYENKGKFGREEWDRLLPNYQAVCDVPAALFGLELAEAYPEAKVIILNRNVDDWFRSCSKTTFRTNGKDYLRLAVYMLDTRFMAKVIIFSARMRRMMFNGRGNGPVNAKEVYNKYYAEMRENISEDRRLDFRVQDGWKPLCEFLGVPIPTQEIDGEKVEMPFPRENSKDGYQSAADRLFRNTARRVFVMWFPWVLSLALILNLMFPGYSRTFWR